MHPDFFHYRSAAPLMPYMPLTEQAHISAAPADPSDARFWGFGLLPFVGGLLLGGIGGYAAGNNNCYGKNCGGYPQGYPYPAPYPYPYPYPYPISPQSNTPMYQPPAVQYTSNENLYLQPAQASM